MNDEWEKATLEKFITTLKGRYGPNSEALGVELRKQAHSVSEILKSLKIRSNIDLDSSLGLNEAEKLVQHALGNVLHRMEIATQQATERPVMLADALHPCIWNSARELWGAKHFREAVQSAATALNRHLQDKVEIWDKSGSALVKEVFRTSVREPAAPCLRVSGDPSHETVKSRQEGAMFLARACVSLIRNPASHADVQWDEQESLEMLATLSMLARIVDESLVVSF